MVYQSDVTNILPSTGALTPNLILRCLAYPLGGDVCTCSAAGCTPWASSPRRRASCRCGHSARVHCRAVLSHLLFVPIVWVKPRRMASDQRGGRFTASHPVCQVEKLSTASFCRRRLAVVMVRLKMAQTLREAVTFIEQVRSVHRD